MVPMTRSQKAFAVGVRIGVLRARTPKSLNAESTEDLNYCATHYPTDLAPLFSFGLVLTMKNQNVYAKALADRARPAPSVDQELGLPLPRPWPLLNQAADLFERVMNMSPMLSRAAKLNLAHVLCQAGR